MPAFYPSYRHSGIDWLGKIPAHWRIGRLKFLANARTSNVDKHIKDGEVPVQLCNYVDVYKNEFITPDLKFMQASATPAEVGRFTIKKADVLITKDSESWDDIAVPALVAEDLDAVLCGYHLAIVRSLPGEFHAGYLFRLLSSDLLNYQFKIEANGVTRFGLPISAIENALLLRPPFEEQVSISDYIDRKTKRIDALIDKKRRLLELLEEKRLAVITQAVTQGFNTDVRLRCSGVHWIGEIPAHWEVKRLDHINDPFRPIMYGIVLPGPHVDGGVPIIKGGDVRPERLNRSTLNCTTQELDEQHARSRVVGGDLVYAIRGSFGEVEIVPNALAGANLTQDAARIAPINGIVRDWLLFALKSETARQQLDARSIGATIKGINIRDLKRVYLPVPPEAEQDAIARHLSARSQLFTRLRAAILNHLKNLAEYRSALITSAVTGKVDVRGVGEKEAAAA